MDTVTLHSQSERLQSLLISERDYEAGFALGRHILRHYPRHLETYVQLAQAALAVGLLHDATDLFHRALSADPEAPELWDGLSAAASGLGAHTEAQSATRRSRDLRPNAADAPTDPLARAVAAATAGQWPQALQLYQRASRQTPDRIEAALGLATALRQLERYEASQSVAEAVLAQLPYCLKAHLLIVFAAQQLDNDTVAEKHLRTARTLDPDDRYAWHWFGKPDHPLPPERAALPIWNDKERWAFNPATPPPANPTQTSLPSKEQ